MTDEYVKEQASATEASEVPATEKKPCKKAKEPKLTARQEAREAVFCLLFETEYHDGETESPETILERAALSRDVKANNAYVRETYLGACAHMDELDELIGRHAKGWRTGRLSRVSRAIIRLGVYEMKYREDIPNAIAINEAVELSKRYDAPKARAFINGVLNAVKDELEGKHE